MHSRVATWKNGHPVIKIKNINPPDVDISDVLRIPTSVIEANPRIEKFRLDKGDILIAMTGATVGKVGRMPTIAEPHYLNQRVGKVFVTDGNAANEDFVYYVISQDGHVDQMFDLADGSAQANISGKQIESLEIPLPPLHEQKAIAHVLGSLDDKIELNRRMNETLEGMAQALFKSWFVDFDPVIDNALAAGNPIPEPLAQRAETRRQAIANGTANRESAQAFPASFRFTEELGWIPEGWEAGIIGKLASVKGGYAFKSKDFKEEGFPVLKIKNIVGDGTISITDCDFISHSLAEKNTSFELKDGNLLMAMTGATVGKIGLLLNNNKRAYLNQRVAKISGKAIANLESYLFCFFKLKKNFDTVVSTAEGSAQPNISSKQIENIPCPISNSEIIEDFLRFSQPVFQNWIENLRKSQTLAKLRDTLLPKLISGELRIPQAEKMVEKAVA